MSFVRRRLCLPLMSVAAALAGGGVVVSADVPTFVRTWCLDCHDADVTKGGLDLAALLDQQPSANGAVWEKVVRRLSARQMPPAGKQRPDEAAYADLQARLTTTLDEHAAAHPHPGAPDRIRRLSRREYQHAIRDLLALDIDAARWLPADAPSHGFDHINVGTLSPVALDRAITAAQQISRLAVGAALRAPDGHTIRLPPDLTQEDHVPGLPFGTRGGTRFIHTFSRDGTYEVRVRLTRDRNEEVEGLHRPHDLLVLLDGVEVASFTVAPMKGVDDSLVDAHLHCRIPVTAGAHTVGVTFRHRGASLEETARQPYQAHFNAHRHPRLSPAVFQVSLTGPFDDRGPGTSASRAILFKTMPAPDADVATQRAVALANLRPLLRRAYRRPATADEEARILAFYDQAQAERGFAAGIEAALSAILVSRPFLFRVERQPPDLAPGAVHAVDDHDLAARLSFFLWSSIPDDGLLDAAERGDLQRPEVLIAQAKRLLADARAESLVTSFADQWLHLRNLEAFTPDARLFPDFDDNLRQAMRRETELLVAEVIRADRSVLDLIVADHTWLNERLARHYGIPHVIGPHFRRVALPDNTQRGGLLRHASVLTVTSYATRTSPVIRGKWVLETILGTPPPPPAPDVPALDDNAVAESLPVRERLAKHRADPTCASCHDVMDPVGFAFEHYDALGRWREHELGHAIDASGALPDGAVVAGVPGLERGVVQRPELFATALAERLLVYALGRGLDHHDAPAVRAIVRHAAANGYRFSAFVTGIVTSAPFRLRGSHG